MYVPHHYDDVYHLYKSSMPYNQPDNLALMQPSQHEHTHWHILLLQLEQVHILQRNLSVYMHTYIYGI